MLIFSITYSSIMFSGEVECRVRKRQRNETNTNSMKTHGNLRPKHDGILTVHVNAKSMEVGFMEVVGNAIIIDLKKRAGDREKLFKGLSFLYCSWLSFSGISLYVFKKIFFVFIAMQISIFYQHQHHQERGATEDQILNIQSFGILVYRM